MLLRFRYIEGSTFSYKSGKEKKRKKPQKKFYKYFMFLT